MLVCLFKQYDDDPSTGYINDWYIKLLQALFYAQGVLLPLLRMLEPGSMKLHLRLLSKILRCRIKEAEDEAVEPICILFNSTLNIEFVYVTLEGIVKFSRMNFSADER